MAFRSF